MNSVIRSAIKETPARLKLADLIDKRNVLEEQLRGPTGSSEQSLITIKLRDIETSVRLTVIDVIIEEAQSAVSELDAAAKAFVLQVGKTIRTLDDFAAVTKASGCKHSDLQAAYAKHARLNEEVDRIGTKLVADMNLVAAEAAALKWSGASSGGASTLAVLAKALANNPMAMVED